MAAITWRNVNGPSNDGVLKALVQQPEIIGNSLQELGGQFDNISAEQDTARVNNMLAKLDSFKTIDEVNAFEQSDEGRMMRESILRSENQATARGADDARIAGIMDSETKANAYDTQQKDYAQKQLEDPIKNKLALDKLKFEEANLPEVQKTAQLNQDTAAKTAEFNNKNLAKEQQLKELETSQKLSEVEQARKSSLRQIRNEPIINETNNAIISKNYKAARELANTLQGEDRAKYNREIIAAETADAVLTRNVLERDREYISATEGKLQGVAQELAKATNYSIGSSAGQKAVFDAFGGNTDNEELFYNLVNDPKNAYLKDIPIDKAVAAIMEVRNSNNWYNLLTDGTTDGKWQAALKEKLDIAHTSSGVEIAAAKTLIDQQIELEKVYKLEKINKLDEISDGEYSRTQRASEKIALKAQSDAIKEENIPDDDPLLVKALNAERAKDGLPPISNKKEIKKETEKFKKEFLSVQEKLQTGKPLNKADRQVLSDRRTEILDKAISASLATVRNFVSTGLSPLLNTGASVGKTGTNAFNQLGIPIQDAQNIVNSSPQKDSRIRDIAKELGQKPN